MHTYVCQIFPFGISYAIFIAMESLLLLHINKYKVLFIFWNLLLAFLPCLIVYYMEMALRGRRWEMLGREKGAFIALFLFWLFLFPNTAYLFMTVRHLANYCADLDKYRVCAQGSWIPFFFFLYASIGIPTFYYALSRMQRLIKTLFGKGAGDLFPILTIPLTSIALLFGLYGRFNSWDVLLKPMLLVTETVGYFQDFSRFRDFAVFTAGLYLIYYITDRLVRR